MSKLLMNYCAVAIVLTLIVSSGRADSDVVSLDALEVGEESSAGKELGLEALLEGDSEADIVDLGETGATTSASGGGGKAYSSGKKAYSSAAYGSGYGSGYASAAAPSQPGCDKAKNNTQWYTKVKADPEQIKILTPSLVNMTKTKMRCASPPERHDQF